MGFSTRETMSGTHEFVRGAGPSGQQPFAFRLRWGPERLSEWLNPFGQRFLWQECEGEVLVGGLCGWTPCRGTLELRYWERRIRYSLDFEVAGAAYHYRGEKADIRLWNLAVSHTTCHGTLAEVESGKLVSTSLVTFKLHHLPRMLTSLRWRRP